MTFFFRAVASMRQTKALASVFFVFVPVFMKGESKNKHETLVRKKLTMDIVMAIASMKQSNLAHFFVLLFFFVGGAGGGEEEKHL